MKLASMALLAAVLGCGVGEPAGPTYPLSNGTTIPLPAQCRVETVVTVAGEPYAVTFRLHHEGSRSAFLAVAENCGPRATVASCASGFHDQVLPQVPHGTYCSCPGKEVLCANHEPGCQPSGEELLPGAGQIIAWQATINLLTTQAGQTCTSGTRNLPAGRYRFSAPVFATAEDATRGSPVLFTVTKDFELPAPGGTVEVPLPAP